MSASVILRRGLLGLVAVLLVAAMVIVGFAAAVQAGHFKKLLVHLIETRIGRPFEVHGTLTAVLLSSNPKLVAQSVVIGNPPWMPPGQLAEIGELTLVLQMPVSGHRFGVESLAMKSATLYLSRDESGRANWQWSERGKSRRELHIVKSLEVPDARVTLDDARRHLKFRGTASAASVGARPLVLTGKGELNGRAVDFQINGDPLSTASHRDPYKFAFNERSSGTSLRGTGSLPRPFDFDAIEAQFEAEGADLKDLYFLTGASLTNTGSYRLSGKFVRHGLQFDFSDLSVKSGESDAGGRVFIDSTGDRSRLDVELESKRLRMADLGERAAGRAPAPVEPALILSNAALHPQGMRRSDAKISFHAAGVEVGRISLRSVAAAATLERGVLTVTSLSAQLLGGKLNGRGRLDANKDLPTVSFEIGIDGLELGQIHHKEGTAAPIEGAAEIHITGSGSGTSVHQIAASANGTVTVVVPKGTVRDSLAEATGMDLRALGLMLAKDKRETELRCAVGVLKDRDGTLSIERFVADTAPVLITGEGQMQFAAETLDLKLSGEPKSLRLFHWRSPITIKGTLAHPVLGVAAHHLEVVDAGKAKDADCAALIASVEAATRTH